MWVDVCLGGSVGSSVAGSVGGSMGGSVGGSVGMTGTLAFLRHDSPCYQCHTGWIVDAILCSASNTKSLKTYGLRQLCVERAVCVVFAYH